MFRVSDKEGARVVTLAHAVNPGLIGKDLYDLKDPNGVQCMAAMAVNTIEAVRKGNELTNATQEAFKENAEISKKIAQLVDEIATASEEQAQGISQVGTAVTEMDKVTQSTAANAEESAASAEELSAQAEQMKGFVDELAAMVGGRGSGDSSQLSVAAPTRPNRNRAPLHAALPAPKKSAVKGLAVSARGKMKVTRPDQVIPLEDADFKDF